MMTSLSICKENPDGRDRTLQVYYQTKHAALSHSASCAMKHMNVLVIRFNLSEILFYGRFEWYICVRNCKQAEFTLMHLADAFIQSDLHIQAIHFFLFLCVFPGN